MNLAEVQAPSTHKAVIRETIKIQYILDIIFVILLTNIPALNLELRGCKNHV
jgi:hypothetical protein